MPDEEEDYKSAFSLDGLPDLEEEEIEEVTTEELGKITATLADFPVDNWDSKNDAQHIVDWYNDLAAKREIEPLSFREFMNMTGNRHFDSINDAQDFLDFALMMLNSSESDREWHHSENYTPGEGTWAGLAIFWVITILWCSASFFATVMIGGSLVADLRTGDWSPIEAIIIDSGVHESSDSEGGTNYCPWIEYEYTIENETHIGKRVSYSIDNSCNSWGSDWADEYPPGENVTIYVNPDDPQESVLLPGLEGIDLFICCFACFPLIGIIMLVLVVKATYASITNPEKYIVGNIYPGDGT
mgnify:CR=1 FL=1